MGKKRTRSKYVSKGTRSNVSKDNLKLASRNEYEGIGMLHKVEAWLAGKNPWITIENVDGPSNQKFIKVRANDLYGHYKNASYGIFRGKEQ